MNSWFFSCRNGQKYREKYLEKNIKRSIRIFLSGCSFVLIHLLTQKYRHDLVCGANPRLGCKFCEIYDCRHLWRSSYYYWHPGPWRQLLYTNHAYNHFLGLSLWTELDTWNGPLELENTGKKRGEKIYILFYFHIFSKSSLTFAN